MLKSLFGVTMGNAHNHLIILHGVFGMSDNWNSIGKQLSEYSTVHLLDVRNHGKSFHSQEMNYPIMAGDVISYLKKQNIEKATIMGHSMGGKIAMQAILDYPDFFQKAAIIDIAPKKYPPQHNEVILALKKLDLSVIKKRSDIEDQLTHDLSSKPIRQWLMKSIYLENHTYKFRFNLEAILNNYTVLSDGIIVTEHTSSPVPTLFIKGENSDYIDLPNDLVAIESLFPNYKLAEIKNAGHWTHVDNPTDLYQSILAFFTSL